MDRDGWRFINNYDVFPLHYDGVDGSGGFGYNVRTAGLSSEKEDEGAMDTSS
mgnify:FL=1